MVWWRRKVLWLCTGLIQSQKIGMWDSFFEEQRMTKVSGDCGKAADLPRSKKRVIFFDWFLVENFYISPQRDIGSISHILCKYATSQMCEFLHKMCENDTRCVRLTQDVWLWHKRHKESPNNRTTAHSLLTMWCILHHGGHFRWSLETGSTPLSIMFSKQTSIFLLWGPSCANVYDCNGCRPRRPAVLASAGGDGEAPSNHLPPETSAVGGATTTTMTTIADGPAPLLDIVTTIANKVQQWRRMVAAVVVATRRRGDGGGGRKGGQGVEGGGGGPANCCHCIPSGLNLSKDNDNNYKYYYYDDNNDGFPWGGPTLAMVQCGWQQ